MMINNQHMNYDGKGEVTQILLDCGPAGMIGYQMDGLVMPHVVKANLSRPKYIKGEPFHLFKEGGIETNVTYIPRRNIKRCMVRYYFPLPALHGDIVGPKNL